MTDRWKPIRNGKYYCSPRCGFKCTWAEFQHVTKLANELAAKLGPGWKPRVWENLGWHYEVKHAKSRTTISPAHHSIDPYVSVDVDLAPGQVYTHADTSINAIKATLESAKHMNKNLTKAIAVLEAAAQCLS